jgi:hypothetical protein
MKRKSKCYIITERGTKRLQGAFPYTESGKEMAEKYLKKINKSKNFEIETK